jgi:hypothetical protein
MSYDVFNYTNEENTGEVAMLSPSGATELRSNATRGLHPRAALHGSWSLLDGVFPKTSFSHTDTVLAAAGSQILAQAIVDNQGAVVKWRAILLESSTGTAVVQTVTGTVLQTLGVNQYVDVLVDSSGNRTGTTTPAAFSNNTPGSVGLLDIVEQAKLEMGFD